MTEWTELKTLQEVAEAQSRGDEIEVSCIGSKWEPWTSLHWHAIYLYRSRPRKKTKLMYGPRYQKSKFTTFSAGPETKEPRRCQNEWLD